MSGQKTYNIRPGIGYPGTVQSIHYETVSGIAEGTGVKPGVFVERGTDAERQVKAGGSAPFGVVVRQHTTANLGDAGYVAGDGVAVLREGLIFAKVAGASPAVGDTLAINAAGEIGVTGTKDYNKNVNAVLEGLPDGNGVALIRVYPVSLRETTVQVAAGGGLTGDGTQKDPLTLNIQTAEGGILSGAGTEDEPLKGAIVLDDDNANILTGEGTTASGLLGKIHTDASLTGAGTEGDTLGVTDGEVSND